MRKIGAILSVVLCCILFMGAAGERAPVLPSRNFYINDHAKIIDKEYRDAMLSTATELFDKTGTQIIVLTVQSLGDSGAGDYAGSVFNGWGIGGENGNGALILFSADSGRAFIHVGEGLRDILTEEKVKRIYKRIYKNEVESPPKAEDYTTGLYDGFSDAAKAVFDHYGEKSSAPKPKKKFGFSFGGLSYPMIAVLAVLIVLRSLRVSSRYRKRYNTPYVYKRRPYTRNPIRYDDDYPSGFGGTVTVKEHDYEDDFWDNMLGDYDESDDGAKEQNADEADEIEDQNGDEVKGESEILKNDETDVDF